MITAALLLLAAQARAAPGCEAPVAGDALQAQMAAAEAGWRSMDAEAFVEGVTDVNVSLACLYEVLLPEEIVRYYQLQGLAAFQSGNSEAADAWFTAARSLDPDAELPEGLVRSGHPARTRYEQVAPVAGVAWLPPPTEGSLWIDGAESLEAPTARAYLFQRLDGQGALAQTAVVLAGASPPSYEWVAPGQEDPDRDLAEVESLDWMLRAAPLRLLIPALGLQVERSLGPRWSLGLYAEGTPWMGWHELRGVSESASISWWLAGVQARHFSRARYTPGGAAGRWYVGGAIGLNDYRYQGDETDIANNLGEYDEALSDNETVVYSERFLAARPAVLLGHEWLPRDRALAIALGIRLAAPAPLEISWSLEYREDGADQWVEGEHMKLQQLGDTWPIWSYPTLELGWRL